MSRETVQFYQMLTGTADLPPGADEPDPSQSFDDHCVHCRRMTTWSFAAVVAGQDIYRCVRCGCSRLFATGAGETR